MASVLFRRGDIFERGADLTVLPCSAKAHISRTAEGHVNRFKLPLPKEKELGEIEIVRFPGPGSVTRFIAWAASVMEYRSSTDIIRTIGQRLGQYANEHSELQVIECPLLGTGAGGLDARDSGPALAAGFRDMCTTDATLFVYGQQATVIEALRLAANIEQSHEDLAMTGSRPTVFISYGWESADHKKWVRDLALRLRSDGVDAKLDQWHTAPGDQLTEFMEREIRENDYVLIICTPDYRTRSDSRRGGVGYEGDIMTGEAMTSRNNRKFIPIVAKGSWEDAGPSWLKGKYHIDLASDAHFERGYEDLITTLHGAREQAPPLGERPANLEPKDRPATSKPILPSAPDTAPPVREPLRILGVVVDEVTEPCLDGTPGSALYRVPLRLSHRPSSLWSELFLQTWNSPPRYTSMHRPGIATVTGDKIILDGTTIEEVERYHRDTLILCVAEANNAEEKVLERRRGEEALRKQRSEEHRSKVENESRRLKFD
ncbi:MAG TPA: toll/interleukin-1 receptor domain-containing protein [Terriglobales bacterium]